MFFWIMVLIVLRLVGGIEAFLSWFVIKVVGSCVITCCAIMLVIRCLFVLII